MDALSAKKKQHKKKKGKLFVITGSSGVGKTTIARSVLAKLRILKRVVTCTTRPSRAGEKNGVDYRFFSKSGFQELLKKNAFLEHAVVYENYYGSLKKDADKIINSGKSVLFVVDVQGAKTIKEKFPSAVTIFIKPPAFEALRKRLENRSKDSKEIIEGRLRIAEEELSRADEFDYSVVNDDLNEAISETKRIIENEAKK
ncbi:MAG: guanylate kinase [Candidatus Diapherotrites archaeon]|nr:guanylate kinase [Candidatus Diapherotrites archaeon]